MIEACPILTGSAIECSREKLMLTEANTMSRWRYPPIAREAALVRTIARSRQPLRMTEISVTECVRICYVSQNFQQNEQKKLGVDLSIDACRQRVGVVSGRMMMHSHPDLSEVMR